MHRWVACPRRFFRKLLKGQRQEPSRLVTDTLGSCRVAHRHVIPLVGTANLTQTRLSPPR
jgi:transposase-like protein